MLRHPSVLLTLGYLLLASAAAVEWKPCPVYTNVALDPSSFFSVCGEEAQPADLKAVCADVPLPLAGVGGGIAGDLDGDGIPDALLHSLAFGAPEIWTMINRLGE